MSPARLARCEVPALVELDTGVLALRHQSPGALFRHERVVAPDDVQRVDVRREGEPGVERRVLGRGEETADADDNCRSARLSDRVADLPALP